MAATDHQESRPDAPGYHPSLEELRAMTDEELDAARICRRCWESYAICGCRERKERPYA
jgi:hypothetical protein